ncbi:MAG: diguanylate cyclase [Gammaproteobacteria bacterium]|nr:diguanylate cyclase [Gammaproteobacteria bacterium]
MPFTRIKIISALLFVVFALYMFLFFRTYIIEKQHESLESNIINTQQYIKKSIDFVISEKKQFYIQSSRIIFNDKNVLRTLKNKDRNNFYKTIMPYYDQLKLRDENFWGLHIIFPDNLSFIRVHKPHVPDDLITKGKKPLIDHVNETFHSVTSFGAGKFGYFLRVVTPIFSLDKHYLGAAEFSINVDSLTQHIKKQFGYEALFLINNIQNKKFLSELAKTKNNLAIFKSTNTQLFSYFDPTNRLHSHGKTVHEHFDYQGKSYSTFSINLSNTATLVVAFDISAIINSQLQFHKYITTLIIFVILIFLIIWFFATLLYIKHEKQIANELQRSHDIMSDNVIYSYTDLKGKIIDVSDAFCNISGYTRKELIGSNHNILSHPDTTDTTYNDLWHTIKNNKIWKGEVKNLRPDGSYYWVESTISPRYDSNNNKLGYMSIQTNISDKKIIETNSITDGLCNVYNRRYFDEIFPKLINIAKRNNEKLCLLILDVDYFKQYNDLYGHQMGDNVLKLIASTLKKSLKRPDDYCFRLGGEEFGMIFKANDSDRSLNFTNKLKENIKALKIIHSGSDISNYITVSIGMVCKPAIDIHNADEIYKETDDLLYQAKNSGRNRVKSNLIFPLQ